MSNAIHRDQAFRDQPSLFDAPTAPAIPVDNGIVSRNETYHEHKARHDSERMKWLTRIIAKGRAGATLDELSAEYHVPASSFSGRFTELARYGLVVRTGERRPTRAGSMASVIVAIDFFKQTNSSPSFQGAAVISQKEFMPDQLTQTSTPTDKLGDLISVGRTYMVSRRSEKPIRVYVFDDGGEVFCQQVTEGGKPLSGSRPQRIDEMDSSANWQLV